LAVVVAPFLVRLKNRKVLVLMPLELSTK